MLLATPESEIKAAVEDDGVQKLVWMGVTELALLPEYIFLFLGDDVCLPLS